MGVLVNRLSRYKSKSELKYSKFFSFKQFVSGVTSISKRSLK